LWNRPKTKTKKSTEKENRIVRPNESKMTGLLLLLLAGTRLVQQLEYGYWRVGVTVCTVL
jgi:hypothetical protein